VTLAKLVTELRLNNWFNASDAFGDYNEKEKLIVLLTSLGNYNEKEKLIVLLTSLGMGEVSRFSN